MTTMGTVVFILFFYATENAGYNGLIAHVTETIRINHDGEVNKCALSFPFIVERAICRRSR